MTQSKILATIIALLSFSVMAHAQIFSSLCSTSYRWDSFSHGVKAVMKQRSFRSRFNDEGCYQMGAEYALELLRSHSESSCKNSFSRALSAGLKLAENHYAADACYSAGYNAGVADLQVAARDGNSDIAGKKCINAYNEGVSDFRANMANDPNSYNSKVERHCYSQGHFEGLFH